MSLPKTIIRQNISTAETRAVGMVATMERITSRTCDINDLEAHAPELIAGALPVGSVEFVREAMRFAGIQEPANISYPASINANGLLCRRVERVTLGQARAMGRVFIKSAFTKTFNGFVLDPSLADDGYYEHDLEQLNVIRGLDDSVPVWVSETVSFVAEWRIYVCDGVAIGMARYDPDGFDGVEEPDPEWIRRALNLVSGELGLAAYSLDVGRLDNGDLVVVECNDAWALGLYGRSLEAAAYTRMLWARWSQLLAGLDAGADVGASSDCAPAADKSPGPAPHLSLAQAGLYSGGGSDAFDVDSRNNSDIG